MRNLTRLFLLAVAIAPVVNCGSAMAQSGDTELNSIGWIL